MKTCGKDCHPLCDFCKFYDFNPGPEGEYRNDGYCNFHKMKKDPIDECENFECGRIE